MTFTVVGKKKCPWCEKATALLAAKDCRFEYFDYQDSAVANKIKFVRAMNMNTVPQIWNKGVHIGGYEQLERHLRVLGNG